MPGRHQNVPLRRRRGVPWLVAAAGVATAGAALLAIAPANADPTPVTAVFSVTGVAASNCKIAIGGSDVYIKPGQELDAKTSVVGVTLLGLPLSTAGIAGFDGKLVINPTATHPLTYDLTATKTIKINGLTTGDHTFTWNATALNLLGLPVNLGLDATVAKAGARLSYQGTIHVTSAAASCGISAQLPGVHVSASVTGLPPIKVDIPGVTLPTIQVSVPDLNPPKPGAGHSTGTKAPKPVSSPARQPGELPVPARVMPKGYGPGDLGGGPGGFYAGALPLTGIQGGNLSPLLPAGSSSHATASKAATQNSTGKNKTIDLAAGRASSSELPVILAILAIIALALVAGTYARLFLRRRTP